MGESKRRSHIFEKYVPDRFSRKAVCRSRCVCGRDGKYIGENIWWKFVW